MVHEKQDHTHDMTVDADWTIETFGRRNGKVLSELLLERSCPMGRGNCQVSPRLLPEESNHQAVDEVPLNRDFTPAKEPNSYAIVIPGPVDWSWPYVIGLRRYGDLRFFAKPEVVPDLSEQLTWVRTACDGDAGRR